MDHGSRVFLQLTLGYLIGRIVVSFAFLSGVSQCSVIQSRWIVRSFRLTTGSKGP